MADTSEQNISDLLQAYDEMKRSQRARAADGNIKTAEAKRLKNAAVQEVGVELGFPKALAQSRDGDAVLRDGQAVFKALQETVRQKTGKDMPEFFAAPQTLRQFMGVEGSHEPFPSYARFTDMKDGAQQVKSVTGPLQVKDITFYDMVNAPEGKNLPEWANALTANLPKNHPMQGQRFTRDNVWNSYNSMPVQMAAVYLNIADVLPRIDALKAPDGKPLDDQMKRTLAFACHNIPAVGRNMVNHIAKGNWDAPVYGESGKPIDPKKREFLVSLMKANNIAYGGHVDPAKIDPKYFATAAILKGMSDYAAEKGLWTQTHNNVVLDRLTNRSLNELKAREIREAQARQKQLAMQVALLKKAGKETKPAAGAPESDKQKPVAAAPVSRQKVSSKTVAASRTPPFGKRDDAYRPVKSDAYNPAQVRPFYPRSPTQ